MTARNTAAAIALGDQAGELRMVRTLAEWADGRPARLRFVPRDPPEVVRCDLPGCRRRATRSGWCRHHLALERRWGAPR